MKKVTNQVAVLTQNILCKKFLNYAKCAQGCTNILGNNWLINWNFLKILTCYDINTIFQAKRLATLQNVTIG